MSTAFAIGLGGCQDWAQNRYVGAVADMIVRWHSFMYGHYVLIYLLSQHLGAVADMIVVMIVCNAQYFTCFLLLLHFVFGILYLQPIFIHMFNKLPYHSYRS